MRTTRLCASARRFSLAIWFGITLLPAPAYSIDPLTMFLFGFARNLIESAIEANSKAQPPAPARTIALQPAPKPPGSLTESDLRTLVDESFSHLTSAQRDELLASLDKTLSDPTNAPHREMILAQFVSVARQIHFTHVQLNRLSADEKRILADRFASNFRSLSPEQQQSLQQQLTQRALPLPADLNDMMLAAVAPAR